MKIVKYIISLILSFLLIFIIIAMLALNLVNNKILNKHYILRKLDETQFYLQVSREVQSGFEKYIYQSGLPEDIIVDLCSEEMIYSDINSIIEYIYEGKNITISENQVQETLDNKINQYLQSEGKIVTSQVQENIQRFENIIVNEYKKNIQISDKVNNMLQEGRQKVTSIYEKVKYISIIAFIIVIILIVINRKDILLGINFISISLLSTGVLLKLVEQIIFKNVSLDNLVVLSTSISNLIINIAKELLYTISDYGTWFIVCGITGIIITSILRYTGKKKEA